MLNIAVCMFRRKATSESRVIELAGHELRLYIIRERRSNQRFGLSSKGLIVRIPIMTSTYELDRILDYSLHWAEKALTLKPMHPVNFRKLKEGDDITFFDGPRNVKFSDPSTTTEPVQWKASLKKEKFLQHKSSIEVAWFCVGSCLKIWGSPGSPSRPDCNDCEG